MGAGVAEPDVEGRLEGADVKSSGRSSSSSLSNPVSSADESQVDVLVW